MSGFGIPIDCALSIVVLTSSGRVTSGIAVTMGQ